MDPMTLTRILSPMPGGVRVQITRSGADFGAGCYAAGDTAEVSGPIALALLAGGAADLEGSFLASLVAAHPDVLETE